MRERDATSPDLHPTAHAARSSIFASAIRDFDQAAAGEDIAWCMSSAFDSALRHLADSDVTDCDRDAMKDALLRAEQAAVCHLPHTFPLASLRAGVAALADLVCPTAVTADTADLRAVARMLQNDFHNLSLREEIAERSLRRGSFDRSDRHGWIH